MITEPIMLSGSTHIRHANRTSFLILHLDFPAVYLKPLGDASVSVLQTTDLPIPVFPGCREAIAGTFENPHGKPESAKPDVTPRLK
jgi:hypothetical protein